MQHQLCPEVVNHPDKFIARPGEVVPVHNILNGRMLGDCITCGARSGDPVKGKTEEEMLLRDTLAGLKCVQAGWAFGVPEDGREQWLDLVVQAVMKKNS